MLGEAGAAPDSNDWFDVLIGHHLSNGWICQTRKDLRQGVFSLSFKIDLCWGCVISRHQRTNTGLALLQSTLGGGRGRRGGTSEK